MFNILDACMCILQISEQVDDVCVTHDENLSLDCLREDSEIRWKFTITTEVGNAKLH